MTQPPIDNNKTYTEQDHKDLEAIKEAVRGRLQRQRAHSELIWDAGDGMYQADLRQLWQLDIPRQNNSAGKARKAGKANRDQWAGDAFAMTERQAHKYFVVRENLAREYVAGTGLCLDRMEQLGLAPLEVRDVLRDLGIEGLSPRALSAGRRAALPYLYNEDDDADWTPDVHGARVETERVARLTDRKETRQDQEDSPAKIAEIDDRPDAAAACAMAERALEEVERLLQVTAGQIGEADKAHLARLLDVSERLTQAAKLALERATEGSEQGAGVQKTQEVQKEASETAPAVPSRPQYRRPAVGVAIRFDPLLQARRSLGPFRRDELEFGLGRALSGKPVEDVEAILRPVFEAWVNGGVQSDLAEHWMALITDEDPKRRGRFALWFADKLRSTSLQRYLSSLPSQDLLPDLRQEIASLLGHNSLASG